MAKVLELLIPESEGEFTLELPIEATILSIQMKPRSIAIVDLVPYLCVRVYNQKTGLQLRQFRLVKEDEVFEGDYVYIGSFLKPAVKVSDKYLVHLFEDRSLAATMQ